MSQPACRWATTRRVTAYRPGGVNVVVLCSDGVANVGLTDPEGIVAPVAEEGRRGHPPGLRRLRIGNYNDHLMEQLADRGDGFYRYVDTREEAEQLYVHELTSSARPGGRRCPYAGRVRPRARSASRLVGYENRAMADESFGDLDADAGELGAGHHASALYDVRLAEGVRPGDQIGLAKVSGGLRAPTPPASTARPSWPRSPGPDDGVAGPGHDRRGPGRGGQGRRGRLAGRSEDVLTRAIALERSGGLPGASELVELVARLEELGL